MPKNTAASARSEFADRLKSLREKKLMAAADLARFTDVSPASVWQWEHAGAMPRRETLDKLASALDTSTGYLLGQTASSTKTEAPSRNPQSLDTAPLEQLIDAIRSKGFRVTVTSD